MNLQAYTLDSLRRLVRILLQENQKLRSELKQHDVFRNQVDIFDEKEHSNREFDEDQGGRIISRYITKEMATAFFTLFWGRQDVYAKRGSKGGYFPQCENRWNSMCPKQHGVKKVCDSCENKNWTRLTPDTIIKHLVGYKKDGSDVIGIYPLFPDGTCRFIVFDFDNHEKGSEKNDYANEDNEWRDEVDALRIICKQEGIEPLVERSRSGRGAHVWILFSKPISAATARKFGSLLLDKGASTVNLRSFKYYDRMYPSQDTANSIGNLIALPLQGQALKDGNSAFVDEYWNAYPDQWEVIRSHFSKRLSPVEVEQFVAKCQTETASSIRGSFSQQERPKPWKRNAVFNKADVTGIMHIVIADGVYIDCLNLTPRLQNQVRALAAFDNPVYYKNKNLGLSNYYNFSSVYLGKDINGYIKIPRGLRETFIDKCKQAGIQFDISDERETGRPIRASFKGDLRLQQDIAAQALLSHDDGILSAATAFGKTVVCSYLIAQRKLNTLILVPRKDLLAQWTEELSRFLKIDENPPEYTTKTGRIKTRKSVIGMLQGSKNTLTGIVDVAMIGSIHGEKFFSESEHSYGMVIIDECHHAASETFVEVLQNTRSKYVYGVSATLKRSDKLEPITYMMLGPVRHSFTAMDRVHEQGIGHYVMPRFTKTVPFGLANDNIAQAYSFLAENADRNRMIIEDVQECIRSGRTPVILTRLKSQAKLFYNKLSDSADSVFLLYGDNSDKENREIRESLKAVKDDQSLILIATGQKIGEGFNYPRLDTLMLSAPVSDGSLLEQYVGRLNRDYPGKSDVIVYDYIDSHMHVFDNMYNKRLRTYRRIGFDIITGLKQEKQRVNAIYNADNYKDVFEQDLVEANSSIVISCSDFMIQKIDRLLQIVEPRMICGVNVMLITADPDALRDGEYAYYMDIRKRLESHGISIFVTDSETERFAVIDDHIVWHGSVNFLGKEDIWDNLIRVESESIAAELKELAFRDA